MVGDTLEEVEGLPDGEREAVGQWLALGQWLTLGKSVEERHSVGLGLAEVEALGHCKTLGLPVEDRHRVGVPEVVMMEELQWVVEGQPLLLGVPVELRHSEWEALLLMLTSAAHALSGAACGGREEEAGGARGGGGH